MKMHTATICLLIIAIICSGASAAESSRADELIEHGQSSEQLDNRKMPEIINAPKNWRNDSTVKRRPASYVGGSLNYLQMYTWLAKNDDHRKLRFGPLHSAANILRVGDAFGDKFALGFQVQFLNAKRQDIQLSAFALLLDLSFYPWKGLGIRPSAGFGFGFAQGENKWEFGFGGPGTLSFALLYEFRITRKMTLAPVVQATWLTGDGYDGLFALAGLEMLFWLPNRNRYK